MEHDASSSEQEARIEHESASWHARRDRGLTAPEQDEFFSWLAADPRHGEWLSRHRQTVVGLKMLAQWRPEHGSQPNPDLLAAPQLVPARPAGQRVRLRWAIGLATAASVALMLRWKQPAPQTIPTTEPTPTAFVTRKVLDDGSSIDLRDDAIVEVTYTPSQRNVRLLKGEAMFHVAKNAARPFIVDAAGVQARAVGTAFRVDLRAQSVEVLVTEGKVQVNQPDPAPQSGVARPAPAIPVLEAGQRTVVSLVAFTPPKIEPVASREMDRPLVGSLRQLEFNDTPLAQVVAEFNGANRIKLVVDDPTLASVPIGASLRSDNVEGFVRLLEASFGVKAEHRPDGVIVLRRSN